MFAVSAWERERSRLFLARGRAGIEPLFWGRRDRYLVFELYDGNSYTEVPSDRSKVKYINQFYRNDFSYMKLIFDMSSFDLKRTKEELFAGRW